MAQLRILHVVSAMRCAGAENLIMNIYRKLDRDKIQFDFVADNPKKEFFDDEIKAFGGKMYYVPRFKGYNYFSYKKAWEKIFDEHKEYKIIHGHVASSAAVYLRMAKKRGLVTISHSHNTKNTLSLKNILFKIVTFPVRFIADYCLACSLDAGISRFGRKIVNDNKRFMILRNGIEVEKYEFSPEKRDKIRQELGLEGKFVVGHIGRFSKVKNHGFLIDVFEKIQKKRPDSVLLLVGDGELRGEIEENVRLRGLSEKVIFAGLRDDVNLVLQAMDSFVFPSFHEGLGIVVIEAEATGLNCFINEKLPEDLQINENVIRLPLDKPAEEWAEKILSYKSDFDRKDGCKKVSADYDIDEVAGRIEKFYLEIG